MSVQHEILPPYSAPEQLDGAYYSEQLLNGVEATTWALREHFPEYRGTTAFGSAVRGEAGPDSDADIIVYVTPDMSVPMQSGPNVTDETLVQRVSDDKPLAGAHVLHAGVGLDYKIMISDALKDHGVSKSDIIVLPISEKIVSEEADAMLAAAAQWETGRLDKLYAPRNIRGLFHAPIDANDLAVYQRQVIDKFAASRHGEAAWAMMRRMIVAFEAGRNAVDYTSAPWRHIPENLTVAAERY